MAWMSDEQYELMKDTRDKKHTTRSARNTRTHCGKSGCNLPHERLSKKELKAMNGEVKSFRMNDPMTWEEFKELPDDLKVCYVQALRKKFGVTTKFLAQTWEVAPQTLHKWFKTLGLSEGKGAGGTKKNWNPTEFLAWWNGVDISVSTEEAVEPVEAVEEYEQSGAKWITLEEAEQAGYPVCDSTGETRCSVPVQGSMVFEGNIDDVLRSVSRLLDGQYVHIKVEWDLA